MKYPESILKGRKSIEGCVLGCLFKDILLMKEYKIKESDFISTEGKFYCGILNNLLRNNICEITDTDIRLTSSDDVIQQYKDYGGMKTIEKLKKSVDLKNFQSYLDELCKRNLFMKLVDEEGMDLEIPREIGNTRQSYLEFFKSQHMTSDEIVKFLSLRILNKCETSINNGVKEATGKIPDEYLERLFTGGKLGVLFDKVEDITLLPHISKEVLGLKKKTLSMFGAFVNVGKTTMLCNIILSLASKGQTVLAITNEMEIDDFYTNFIIYIINNFMKYKGINKRKLKSGALLDDEKNIVRKAKEIYDEKFSDNIVLCSTPDSDIEIASSLVRKYSLSKNIDVLCYDTFKQNFDKDGEVSYKDLIKDSRTVYKLCKTYDLIGLCAIQLSQQYFGNLVLDLSMLAGAKQINEILENLFMMRTLYKVELDKNSKYYIHPYRKEKIDGKWEEKEIELDPNGNYRVAFITKARDCQTFEDSNEAVLLSYNGWSGTFKEICLCHPQRGFINQNYLKK